jgi:hypothetical protein
MKGDAFTIQLGHLIDWMVASLLKKNQEDEGQESILGEYGL